MPTIVTETTVGEGTGWKQTAVGTTPATVFAIDFPFFGLDDIVVEKRVGTAGGVILLRGVDYNITGTPDSQGVYPTGTVTLFVAVASCMITLWRETSLLRSSNLPLTGYLDRTSLNADLNREVVSAQDERRHWGLSLKFSEYDFASVKDLTMPLWAFAPSSVIGFDGSGVPTFYPLGSFGGGSPTGPAGGALSGTYPNPTLVGGPLSNYLTTATAAATYITAAAVAAGYQPLDAQLTGLAALDTTTGLVEQTGAATFAKRALGVATSASVLTRADGDGRYLGTGSSAPPSGAAGGALAGTYPNPTLVGGPLSNYAPLAGPTFTGVPAAPTAAPGNNTTQLATTAFVTAAVAAGGGGGTGVSIGLTPPASPVAGQLWWFTDGTTGGGQLYLWYVDANSSQWVPSVTSPISAAPSGAAGGDLAGTYPNPTLAWISRVAAKTLTLSNTMTLAGTDGSTLNIGGGGTLGSAAFTASSAYQAAGATAGGALSGTYPNPTLATAYMPIAGGTFTGKVTDVASAAGGAGTNFPHGAAPTAPVNGDIWTTTTGIFVRVNGATVGPLISAASIPGSLPPSGSAGGDLAGSYPNPTLAWISRTASQTLAIGAGGTLGSNAFNSTAYLPLAGGTLTGLLTTIASATGTSGFNLPHGAAPTAPVNGDVWTTSAGGLFTRINGVTVNLAPLASPTFTGTPAAPTATVGTNTTQIATTAFVQAALALVPQNAQTGNYTAVLADAGDHLYHAVAAAAATYTIPANASVAYTIGTTITFVNDSTNAVTIAIASDTLVWSPSGGTGSRTLAQFGMATALKVTSTRWIISGTGLT